MPPPPEDFDAAVAWFRARVPVTDDEFEALRDLLGERAFHVAGVSQLELVTQVWTALDRAIARGTTLADFKKDVGEQLSSAWGGEHPYRVETLFRTWVQRAYSAGRYEVMTHPEVKKLRPFWKFEAILDSRTSIMCQLRNGTVRPADDAWWATNNPPIHFSCRSTVITLTPDEATEEGVTEEPPDSPPSPGFGAPPTLPIPLDLGKYPPELVHIFQRKQGL